MVGVVVAPVGRFVAEVDYITSPGHGTGAGWREGAGLPERPGTRPHGGPDAIITTLGVLRFDEEGEMFLAMVHPGVSVAEVQANTGWELKVAEGLTETAPPTAEELAALQGVRVMAGGGGR